MNSPPKHVNLTFSAAENPLLHKPVTFKQLSEHRFLICFEAMASTCELHFESSELKTDELIELGRQAIIETWRIEAKFSRYREGNIIHQINNAQGKPVQVDAETANLLDYAAQCYSLSDGMFDITSGPLRRIWKFTGEEGSPEPKLIAKTLNSVGWNQCRWQPPYFSLPHDGEIDFGGIGKEYAVDRVCQLIQQIAKRSVRVLVNFGGDIVCSGPRLDGSAWKIGLEKIDSVNENSQRVFDLTQGAIATSGDTHRFLTIKGQRFSHILSPKTGWPVAGAPQTVTVFAPTCTLAGMMATFAMLQGASAEAFLDGQSFPHWIQRSST